MNASAPEPVDTDGLLEYIQEQIPLTRAMGVSFAECSTERVVLAVPLEPNMNHRGSAFGGSVSAAAVLAAWTLMHVRVRHRYPGCRIVIQRQATEYLLPVTGDFTVVCTMGQATRWDRLHAMVDRKGVGRVVLQAQVELSGTVVARFEGTYVILRVGA